MSNYYLKRYYASKNKVIIYGSGLVTTLFSLLVGLGYYGISINTSSDVVCGTDCISYFNITTTSTSLCFGKTFYGPYLEGNATFEVFKADMRYKLDNPERWKLFNFTNNCLDRGKTTEFMLKGHKNKEDTIKWGVSYLGENKDPLWIGDINYSISNNFKVTWYDCIHDIIDHSCKIDIQNLLTTPNNGREFNLSAVISDTNYDIQNLTSTTTISEWKAIPTNITNSSGTFLRNIAQWKQTKSNMLKEGASLKMYYGSINIPKYESGIKTDDLGIKETINGTKTFKIEWKTPINKLNDGSYGSSGKIAFWDENSQTEYHPWWNTSWLTFEQINISNMNTTNDAPIQTGLLNINTNSLISIGKMKSDCSDARIVIDNITSLSLNITNCNTANTTIRFKTNQTIPAGTSVFNYYFYYNNSAAPIYNSNLTNVFIPPIDEYTQMNLRMEEASGNILDSTLNQLNWSVSGDVSYRKSLGAGASNASIGYAIGFGGVNGYLQNVTNMDNFGLSMNNGGTFEAMIFMNKSVNNQKIINVENGTAIIFDLSWVSSTSKLRMYCGSPAYTGVDMAGLKLNKWINVTVIFNNSGCFGYFNGTLSANLTQKTLWDKAPNWHIGKYSDASSYWNGYIDEVRFSSTARIPNTYIRDINNTDFIPSLIVSVGAEQTQPPPTTYTLSGTVKDKNLAAVNGATVYIISQATNTTIGTAITNSTGGWSYSLGTTTGNYTIAAENRNNISQGGGINPHIVVN